MKHQISDYLMAHGVLKNADARQMAEEILAMFGIEKAPTYRPDGQMPTEWTADGKVVPVADTDIVVSSRENYERVMDENLKLIERNHELEQKELLRSASRPAEAKAMKDILEESKQLKAQLESVQKANAELREFALTHFSREQVKPLVEACQAMLDLLDWGTWRTEYTDGRGFLEHLADHILPAVEQALAHARAVGMEDKP